MSKYSWSHYNKNNLILAKKMLSYNLKHKINFFENGLYNHVRDIFSISLLLLRGNKKKFNILDYGSNIACLSNIQSKISTNLYNFFIFDPFIKREMYFNRPFKIKIFNKSLYKKTFDMINFGSSVQYIDNLNEIKKNINFSKVKIICITHTPITLKKKYRCIQSNHLNLIQNVHNFGTIKKFFQREKFKLIFKSRNDDKFIACKNKKLGTFSLNLIFQKI
ncbi:MAG: hypothetical protein CBE46_000800 [Candidatus Pelagibacter sp. TMED286]|nr:MAG: hypothetical protein CBE46_000800 [Candidatus Pelagibacter sp. TMED286]|tara:strand:+ start:904 stop:1563 length:660 start_codon:yes stop_codon:yes gene_type:complete